MRKRKHILNRLLEDWPAKVLSLAGAAGLFFFFQLNKLEERPLSVPLTVHASSQYMSASQYPRTVRLVLRGEPNAIYAILENDLSASIDLSGYSSPGTWRVPVRVERSGSAIGIDPLEISVEPSEVTLALEARLIKELPITPSFQGYLEPGYELVGFTLSPTRVEAAGPASLMEATTEALTEAIELTGRSENFSVRVRLRQVDSLVGYLSSSTVEFSAEVRKAIVYKTFQDLPMGTTGLDDGLALRTPLPFATVRVAASRTELEAFVPGLDSLVADLSSVKGPGVYTVAVVPRFPEGFQVESWMPMVVTLSVEKKTDQSRPDAMP